jgi:hypothetical protein
MEQQPNAGLGRVAVQFSTSYTTGQTQPLGLLHMSDQPVSETTTYTTHNKHNRRTSIPSAWFEPAIPANKQFQTYFLERTATGIVFRLITNIFPKNSKWPNVKKLQWLYDKQKELRTELVKPTCPWVHFFVFLQAIIIIIIIIIVFFMEGIHTHIPETNHVPREYIVAAILSCCLWCVYL